MPSLHLHSVGPEYALGTDNLADFDSINETETMSYLHTPRGYTMRSTERPVQNKLYQTQPSARTSDPGDVPQQLHNSGASKLAKIKAKHSSGVVDTPITSNTVELKITNKQPKLCKDLDKVEEIYDKFEMKLQAEAIMRFTTSEESHLKLKSGKTFTF